MFDPAGMLSRRTPALMVDAYVRLKQANAASAFVMPPTHPEVQRHSGQWRQARRSPVFLGLAAQSDDHYITAQHEPLSYGMPTTDKFDFQRLQRETVDYTQLPPDRSRAVRRIAQGNPGHTVMPAVKP